MIGPQPSAWRLGWQQLFRQTLSAAVAADWPGELPLLKSTAWTAVRWAGPVLLLGLAGGSNWRRGTGRTCFAPAAISPQWSRLSPAKNLQKLFSMAGISNLLKSLIPMAVITYLGVGILVRDWQQVLLVARATPFTLTGWLLTRVFEISWKAALAFGVAMFQFHYFLQRVNFERQLRMSREEIREEAKETEGNPQIKQRARRVQRQMRRRLRAARCSASHGRDYESGRVCSGPRIPPGRDGGTRSRGEGSHKLLARRIKQEARWRAIPVMENPPLAQALYRAVEVGQAIPVKLYAAVAEILAFIFRAQNRMNAMARPVQAEQQRSNA